MSSVNLQDAHFEALQDGSDLKLASLDSLRYAICQIKYVVDGESYCATGFLCKIGTNLSNVKYGLLTNNHVIGEKVSIDKAGNEKKPLPIQKGNSFTMSFCNQPPAITVTIDPDTTFICGSERLDYTFIEFKEFNYEPMAAEIQHPKSKQAMIVCPLEEKAEIKADKNTTVVGYPNTRGGNSPLMTILRESSGKVHEVQDDFFLHVASTLEGSSGSPVFFNCAVIGIHNAHDLGQTGYNTAVRMDKIIEDLYKNNLFHMLPPRQHIEQFTQSVREGNVHEVERIVCDESSAISITTLIPARDDGRYFGLPLHESAQAGHCELIKRLVSLGHPINARSWRRGATAFHAACLYGQFEAAKTLKKLGACAETANYYDVTPLMADGYKNISPDVVFQIVRWLVEECKVNVNARDYQGKTVLHYVAGKSDRVVEFLKQHGAQVIKDFNDLTPTQYAAFSSSVYTLQGNDNGRKAWHCILLEPGKKTKEQLLELGAGDEIKMTEYGTILRSGRDEDPPTNLYESVEEKGRELIKKWFN